MSHPVNSALDELCQIVHETLNRLPTYGFPFSEEDIPRNGIYVLFETNEFAHGTNRIVRIGTHTGNNQLRSRLKQHFQKEVKDRSIFRKNIGRCLLTQDNDPFLEFWEIDLTTRAAKKEHADKIDLQKQGSVEQRVSAYIRERFRFVVFEVQDKAMRLKLESRLTSTVSRCEECGPSPSWLGLYSPKTKIQSSGLWQVNELHKTPLNCEELEQFDRLLNASAQR